MRLAKQCIDLKLQQSISQLEEADKRQREFMAFASHEFRTPAAIIRASLDSLVYLREAIRPEVQQRLDNIRLASQRLNRLANTLISYDRVRELSIQPHFELVDLAGLIREVLAAYGADQVLFRQEAAGDALELHADSLLLSLALYNLIDNALYHQPDPSDPVMVTLQQQDGVLLIRIADHGPGIPQALRELVFEPYYTTREGAKNGPGLHIARQVARMHGGDCLIEDNRPCGAVLQICLLSNASKVLANVM